MDTDLVTQSASSSVDMLKAWHQQYTAEDGDLISIDCAAIQALQSDTLDYKEIELQVQRLVSTADVVQGFCGKCRYLLDHWPNLEWESQDRDSCAVGRPVITHEIEAAARVGCKFCAFLLSRLKYCSLLDVFRKIEARLRNFGDNGTASLSIQDFWGLPYTYQFLWLNLPGKIACRVNSPGAEIVQFEARILSPTGELCAVRSMILILT